MATPSETSITSEARGQALFRELLRRHEPDLRRAAQRLCWGDEDRAQDLVQDALLRAHEACIAGRFREGGNGQAWLLRIASTLAINDYHRRRRWQTGLEADGLVGGSGATPASAQPPAVPGAALLAGTLDEALEGALAALPAPLRACVHLVDRDGLEYGEAARALRIPIGTVRSRLSRARVRLHGLLRGYAREHGLV